MNKESIDYNALLTKVEELHEDLKPYLDLKSNIFPTLRHPLIYSVPYTTNENALLNKRYELITEEIDKLLKNKKYGAYIFRHERPYRLQAFVEINKLLNDMDYWELLAEIWIDSENIWQNIKIWKRLLNQRKQTKDWFMDEDDKKHFYSLPNSLTVYRGCIVGKNESGLSYTTDKQKAEWFAKRYSNKGGKVITRHIYKKDVFAYTNGRGEKEIIILK